MAWPRRGLRACVRMTSRCGEEWLHPGYILQVVLQDLLIGWIWGVSKIKNKIRITARVLASATKRIELPYGKMFRNYYNTSQ